MHKLALLALVLCPACIAPSPPDAPGGAGPVVGELEGLTIGEAAQAERRKPGELTDCEKECLAFAVAGCSDISDQCDDGNNLAFAGAYVTDCTTAKRLACGHFSDVQECQNACNGWLH